MKVLLATDKKFWYQGMGSDARISGLIDHFSKQDKDIMVFFVGRLDSFDRKALSSHYPSLGVRECPPKMEYPLDPRSQATNSFFPKIFRQLGFKRKKKSPAKMQNVDLVDFDDCYLRSRFREYFESMQPDLVVIEYIRLAFLVKGLESGKCILSVDTHDIMHIRRDSFESAGLGADHWIHIDREQESRILNCFDLLIAIKDEDKAQLKKMAPGKEVVVARHAPEGYDTAVASSGEGCNNVLFFSGGDPANVDALRILVEEIWPQVRERDSSGAELLVAGSICKWTQRWAHEERVSFLGVVDDLAKMYSQCGIVLNPVRAGGGLKIKNVEAMVYGKALVTSSEGAGGLGGVAGQAYVICEAPAEYASEIVRLLSDSRARAEMSGNAREAAKRLFSPQTAYRELDQAVQEREREQ